MFPYTLVHCMYTHVPLYPCTLYAYPCSLILLNTACIPVFHYTLVQCMYTCVPLYPRTLYVYPCSLIPLHTVCIPVFHYVPMSMYLEQNAFVFQCCCCICCCIWNTCISIFKSFLPPEFSIPSNLPSYLFPLWCLNRGVNFRTDLH